MLKFLCTSASDHETPPMKLQLQNVSVSITDLMINQFAINHSVKVDILTNCPKYFEMVSHTDLSII